ncbi:hypothetical protein HELRODRAFT_184015 [Helobdella robusta]|uniref:Uncharacterized protein n=1 Tax=Helobdella robusta TaxID=6412 RepID=T1FKF4_HELRO|nr:hypothetical protein HELRODRAFT_184015 [Helobdella robusta]ESO09625.1 hypothetical protein HELRODRAFT_184015 [Helobdella robusta]
MSKTRSQRSQSIPEPASVKDDNILCCLCDAVVQIEPSDLYDELVKYASKSKNMKFYCDNCVKHADGFKGHLLNEKFESIDSRLKTFDSIDIGMKSLQLRLESSGENLKQLEKLDEKLNQSINSLKNNITKSWSDVVKSNSKIVDNEATSLRNMISTSFSDVVKKDLDVVSKEVISVRKTIEVVNEVKAHRGNVLGFLRFLTDESLKDEDILKIFRQGKKPSVSSPPRPVIVKFINLSAKVLVMRRLFRLALLDEKMRERCGRAMENSEISKACYQTGLNLELLNIRSIRSKYDIIRDLLSNDLDICVLTETWHGSSEDISVKLAMPYGFSFMDYLRPHDPNHGGIIVYFKNVFKFIDRVLYQLLLHFLMSLHHSWNRFRYWRTMSFLRGFECSFGKDELNSDDFAQFFKDKVDNILETSIKEPIVLNNRMSECAELSLFQCCSSDDEIRQVILNSPTKSCPLDDLPTKF